VIRLSIVSTKFIIPTPRLQEQSRTTEKAPAQRAENNPCFVKDNRSFRTGNSRAIRCVPINTLSEQAHLSQQLTLHPYTKLRKKNTPDNLALGIVFATSKAGDWGAGMPNSSRQRVNFCFSVSVGQEAVVADALKAPLITLPRRKAPPDGVSANSESVRQRSWKRGLLVRKSLSPLRWPRPFAIRFRQRVGIQR
jgi:hypothetical protein